MIRTFKLPGSYSKEEMEEVYRQARVARVSPPVYIRQILKLPFVKMGRPNKAQTNGKRKARQAVELLK